MKRAIDETERRRKIQSEYNREHGITPKTIVKDIVNTLEITKKADRTKDVKKQDIPEEIVRTIRENNVGNFVYKAIKNGTPLPKGHGDLVDYEELKNNAREYGAYAEATLSHIKPKTIIEADKEEQG